MSNNKTITLSCIAKNEGHNIDALLNSVNGCVDEIRIVDTGSTDDTVEKAKKHGAEVLHFDWIDDFAAARNFSFENIKTDYVFWLDLDDSLENPDAFKIFKSDVLHLADYWLAPYHYSSDEAGNPTCTFFRERIFNTKKGFRWKYPIHEGVLPSPDYGQVKADMITTWAVRHRRSAQDLIMDRSRNINVLEKIKHTDAMDHRMWYYYGKELFEADRSIEAIPALAKAVTFHQLEMHDRILALQYLTYSYLRADEKDAAKNKENYQKAIQIAQTGLLLAPHRAEFYVSIGDAYLRMGEWLNALPSYEAAKGCKADAPTPFQGALFTHKDSYTVYPMEQIAKIKANSGDISGAKAEADKALTYAPKNTVLQKIKDELDKVTSFSNYSKAKQNDDIVIAGLPHGPYEWDPGVYKTKSMGGSETAAIEMAYWLHKLSGRPIKVFNNRQSFAEFDGVQYIPVKDAAQYFQNNKPYLTINWRHNSKLTDSPTFVWSHDLMTPGVENKDIYNKVMCLTPFHKRYMMARQGVPEDKIYITRNGINPDRFSDGPWEKDPFKFVFGSSPDRGLVRAIRVLDRVRETYKDVKLHIFYGYEHLHKYGLKQLADQLHQMIGERKDWIVYHGATEQTELMRQYKSAAYDIQPSDWIETSCISAMELVCCGVYPIFRKVGGVADTLAPMVAEGMASLVDSQCETEGEFDVYIQETLNAIREERYKKVSVDPHRFDWKSVAQEWLNDLPKFAGYN